jgi:actin cytoskeleton-regulatory complex protein SLA1
VGLHGEYGFAPANYIELSGEVDQRSPVSPTSPHLPPRNTAVKSASPSVEVTPSSAPAAALARIMRRDAPEAEYNATLSTNSPPPYIDSPRKGPQFTPEDSDEEPSSLPSPSLPRRAPSQPLPSPIVQYASSREPESSRIAASPQHKLGTTHTYDGPKSPSGGYHLYNISEMVSALGKKKKMPTTLGLNLRTGNIMIAPEKTKDGPQQEWTAEKLTHYSIEGKHVFMELVRPSKSIDFHAGAKDTAQEIVSGLGEIAGAARAAGLREVLAASAGSGGGRKTGRVLYDFKAQGEDEVTVAVDDEVVIIDDTKSDEWWMVRKLNTGSEGVVPSSYIEETGMISSPTDPAVTAARSVVEQNRLEEERLAKEALKAPKVREGDARGSEVGPGVKLPKRGSSLMGANDGNQSSSQRSKRESKNHGRSGSSSKSSKTRALLLNFHTKSSSRT